MKSKMKVKQSSMKAINVRTHDKYNFLIEHDSKQACLSMTIWAMK